MSVASKFNLLLLIKSKLNYILVQCCKIFQRNHSKASRSTFCWYHNNQVFPCTSDQALTNSGLVSHGTCRQTGLPSILLKLGVAYAAVKKNSRHNSCPCKETGGLECFLA